MVMFILSLSPGQDFRKGIHSLVDGVIRNFLMNITTLDMVFLEMSIKKPFRVMFYFNRKNQVSKKLFDHLTLQPKLNLGRLMAQDPKEI